MRPHTIRGRVTAVAALLTAGVLVGASLLVLWVLRGQLTDNLDEGLAQRADTIEAVAGETSVVALGGDEDLLVQVVAGGQVVAASADMAGLGPIAPLDPGVRTVDDVPGKDETFRVLTRAVTTSEGPATLVVGIDADDVSEPLTIVANLLTVAVPAVVLVLGVLTWWWTGRVLRPVDTMCVQMAEISATNLAGRVPEPGTGDEIDRLARTMNETLARLEEAVRRQQRFVADASHELRSPLTRIRAELEVDLARPGEADLLATERSVLEETVGLQRLVDDLLQVARADAPVAGRDHVAVDLDDIVLREARRLTERGRVAVDTRALAPAQITGDPEQLARAVRNVLDNAERHATTTITVALSEADGQAVLTVADDGAGIPPAERAKVFERFTRLDEARSRDAGGTGLGLAITREIVERHHGSIFLADREPTTFVIELPARP
jgi:signal transduction histidine kinase